MAIILFYFYLCIEEPGFIGFDSPLHNNDVDYNFFENADDQEMVEEPQEDNFQSYQKNALDLQKHEQNQIDIVKCIIIKNYYTSTIFYFTLPHIIDE